MDPETKIPSDYAETSAEPPDDSTDDIEDVYSVADAARAAGVFDDDCD